MWRQWMDGNPQEANDLVDNGHTIISRQMQADFKDEKNDGYSGAPYGVYDASGMAYGEQLPQQPE